MKTSRSLQVHCSVVVTGRGSVCVTYEKYYTIDYNNYQRMLKYLTHFKLLKERIEVTKLILDGDKSTLLCLAILYRSVYSIPSKFERLHLI